MIAFGKDDSFGIGMTKGMDDSLREGPVEFPGGSPIQLAKDGCLRRGMEGTRRGWMNAPMKSAALVMDMNFMG